MGRVIVIGGGFAGLAAAARLANDGHRPVLLERSPRLGGRGSSFVDRTTGDCIDDGQHVLMRCCTVTQGFLRRLDALDAVSFQQSLDIPMAWDGHVWRLRSTLLPGPMHLLPSLLGYGPLSLGERIDVLRAALAFYGPARTMQRFSDWLTARGQSRETICRVWDPISIATLNAPVSDVCQAAARKVFRDAFFHPGGADMGRFVWPLRTIAEKAKAYIEAREGEVRCDTAVDAIRLQGSHVSAVGLRSGEEIEADAVISAVPPQDAREFIAHRASLYGAEFGSAPVGPEQADHLEWAPIVNLHLWFERRVMQEPFIISVETGLQAVFSHPTDAPGAAQRLTISQSAASRWMAMSDVQIESTLLADLRDLLPDARDITPLHALIVRSPRATFVPSPGADRYRPGAATEVGGLYLAGDWTATGWPSTIEGAIRSGIAAAARFENDVEEPENITP